MEPIGAPHISRIFDIEKNWIDYNGHLNMAYYNVLFDRASDDVFERLGMGPAYARSRRLTTYTAEIHVCYIRELRLPTGWRSPDSFSTMTKSDCTPFRSCATWKGGSRPRANA